ncbi:MAG: MgtC/SapB family protein [Blastocatellia bacterium]
MPFTEHLAVRLAIALGIGLLIGAERERRKGTGLSRAPAGIRTFALASLVGGLSQAVGGEALLAAAAVGVVLLSAVSYKQKSQTDPGFTTAIALLTALILGALAVRQPALAAGFAVVVVVLLAARTRLHRFVQHALTGQELQDALLFAAATLVILPLTPDHPIGPFGVLNPRTLWKLAVIVMSISAAGYIAVRALGPRVGLPVAGFASGFVSSAATIGSMGARAAREPELLRAAVAGAVLSTVSTIVQMVAVLFVTHPPTFSAMKLPLLLAGGAAVIYGAVFMIRTDGKKSRDADQTGRAFNLTTALVFAATVSAILLASAAVNRWLGSAGLAVAAGLAGLADTHSAAISVASLAAAEKIQVSDAVLPILVGLTTNTVTKAVVAVSTGGRAFALRIIPGLLLVILAAWFGWALRS